MEISEIINRLESLQGHCESMIDKDDQDSIWIGDAQALRQAVELIKTPKALNINKFQNGGINMSGTKTQVAIRTPDGRIQDVKGDTAIVFTIEKAGEYLDGKATMVEASVIYSGVDIPEPIFAETIGSLVASFVEQRSKDNKMVAAYNLYAISQILEAKSEQIRGGAKPEELHKELDRAVKELFDILRK